MILGSLFVMVFDGIYLFGCLVTNSEIWGKSKNKVEIFNVYNHLRHSNILPNNSPDLLIIGSIDGSRFIPLTQSGLKFSEEECLTHKVIKSSDYVDSVKRKAYGKVQIVEKIA